MYTLPPNTHIHGKHTFYVTHTHTPHKYYTHVHPSSAHIWHTHCGTNIHTISLMLSLSHTHMHTHIHTPSSEYTYTWYTHIHTHTTQTESLWQWHTRRKSIQPTPEGLGNNQTRLSIQCSFAINMANSMPTLVRCKDGCCLLWSSRLAQDKHNSLQKVSPVLLVLPAAKSGWCLGPGCWISRVCFLWLHMHS